ncbi:MULTISPECIES: hypothetical protein [unclassified Agarivorans]|uniref:hypothetical protein n=1 Tax=unclassified Agarivorans TaxID=2636026 RepID=UPI0026E1E0BF|nr:MULTISPECIES: hypothetical protein [unclassified Agarivorans]MDO6685114.1 hypothetical protein [Agarivorans sp. 3_MG-2023]MDO6715714.1 hypothetical protein [Agarivorans sp. 2_MG-2023]
MRIHQLNLEKHRRYNKLSAMLGPFPLWFKSSPDLVLAGNDASPFICSALAPAMFLGEDIVVDRQYYVSATLLENLQKIQTIMHAWNPIFKIINIQATTQSFKPSNKQLGHSVFFSGGVDGTYSLIQHLNQLENLILINGFDFSMDKTTWRNMVARCQRTAHIFDKRLICVESNLKEFTGWTRLARFANFGASLASVALLLNPKSALCSAAVTYDAVHPSNGHPLVDPLWSSESCELSHVGLEADRAKKIAAIKHYPDALHNLWVCWKDPNCNCGRCAKCYRTHMAMQLNDITNFKFSEPITTTDLKQLSPKSEEDLSFYEYLYQLAMTKQNKFLSRVLKQIIWRYRSKQFLRETDRLLLNASWAKWRRGRLSINQLADVSVFPKYSDQRQLKDLQQQLKQQNSFISTSQLGSIFD